MSMGVFMPTPAPVGGTVLDGMITVVEYADSIYGWSDGSDSSSGVPAFGSLTGDAAPYFVGGFIWSPLQQLGYANLSGAYDGAVLRFQGEDYLTVYDSYSGLWIFPFGPEVASWPTSGTHPFTLTLP